MGDDTSDDCCDETTSSCGFDAPSGDGRSLDALFTALASWRARLVLAHLEKMDVEVVELDDLVDHVVERETEAEVEIEVETDSEDHREEVAIELHHNRLPKLDDATVIDYDPRTKVVRYWGDDRARACLDLFDTYG